MHFRTLLLSAGLCAAASHAAIASAALPNYDASLIGASAPAASAQRLQRALRSVRNRGGYRSEIDAQLGTPSFLWAPLGAAPVAVGPLKAIALPESRARALLYRQASLLGLSRDNIDAAELIDISDRGTGPVIARFRQRVAGTEVFNRRISVMMDREGRPVATSGYFAPDVDIDAVATKRGSLDAVQAIASAVRDLGSSLSLGSLVQTASRGDYSLFSITALADGLRFTRAPRSKPVWFAKAGELVPAFYLEVIGENAQGRGQFGYGYVVSADTGAVLFRNNLIANDFSYTAFADSGGDFRPYDGPLGNEYLPTPAMPGDVLPRVSAPQQNVVLSSTLPEGVDPWLPDGATTTEGNNTLAYLDLAAPDGYNAGSDVLGVTTSDGMFDYPIGADEDPSGDDVQQAAIVNLFYVNNWLHDLFYQYGFDEASGNAQTDNYGRGGADGDPVEAEGQDNSGRNNANMLTPGDGSSPRMQMYLFDGPIAGLAQVTAPDALAAELSDIKFSGASFGPGEFEIEATAVELAADVAGEPTDGCLDVSVPITGTTLPAPPQLSMAGKIALIDRGNCSFTTKEQFATLSGATAMVVVNSGDGAPITMGNADLPINIGGISTDPLYILPAIMITKADGQKIKDALAAGESVSMSIRRDPAIDEDGTLDNLVIAHEFFHYVSNRLVNDGSGLSNNQGGSMGEGWGDFASLLIALRADDATPDKLLGAYSTGFYVIPDYYFGIRRIPYSADLGTNCLSFKHIENGVELPTEICQVSFGEDGASNSEVHNAGEIWANMLWEVYVSLVQAHGYQDGRDRMISYLIDGLKMTPSSPTFTEARDGVLAAAMATDFKDFALASRAFAKRGIGVHAVSPPRSDSDHAGVVESYVALVGSAPELGVLKDDDCDGDGVLDAGETATVEVSLLNNGGYEPGSSVEIGISTTAPELSLGSDTLTIKLGDVGETVSAELELSLAESVSEIIELPITLTLTPAGTPDPAVEYPEPVEVVLLANSDIARTATSDDFENPVLSEPDWARESVGTTDQWELVNEDELLGSGTVWFAPDKETASDLSLITPSFSVPAETAFSMSWEHYYSFEPMSPLPLPGFGGGYDGGVVEISVDGGEWTDVLDAGGSFTGAGYNGAIDALDGREGFTGTSAGLLDSAGLVAEGLDFGIALAGSSVRLRFRVVTDELVGDYGWSVDNVSVTGAAEPPFLAVSANEGECTVMPPDDDDDDDGDTGGDDDDGDTGDDDDGDGDGDGDGDSDSDGDDGDAMGGNGSNGGSGGGGAMGWMWLLFAGVAGLLRRRNVAQPNPSAPQSRGRREASPLAQARQERDAAMRVVLDDSRQAPTRG